MSWKAKREKVNEILKFRVIPILRKEGFKGSFPHFRRQNGKHIDIIGFQFSQWGPQFCIEIALAPIDGIKLQDGKFIPPEKVKHYHTGLRTRIGPPTFDFEHENFAGVCEAVIISLDEARAWWSKNKK